MKNTNKKTRELYVVLPCYNEQYSIEKLIYTWKNEEISLKCQNINLNLVIVNDASYDNTFLMSDMLKHKYKNVHLINHSVNKGLGEALKSGINYALNISTGDDLVCAMDADATHLPKYIHLMIDKLNEDKLDCVIASRYQEHSKVEGISIFRRILSHSAKFLYSHTLKIESVKDYTCGYRLYTTKALNKLKDEYGDNMIRERGFVCLLELLYKLDKCGFKIGEIPFILKYSDHKQKIKITNTIKRSFKFVSSL